MNDRRARKLALQTCLKALEIIVRTCERNGLTEVEIPKLLYWEISPDEMFDTSKIPGDLLVGDLDYDADWIERIADGQLSREGLLGLHFSYIASVILYIGHKSPSLFQES